MTNEGALTLLNEKHFGKKMKIPTYRPINNGNILLKLKHKYKTTGNYCVFKFLWRSADGKRLIRFQRENVATPFTNFSGTAWTENIRCVFSAKT